MNNSKAWNWEMNDEKFWIDEVAEEIPYLKEKWKSKNYINILDLGCGLGRHSIYFAKNNFNVYSLDLSEYAIKNLKNIVNDDKLNIIAQIGDMNELPYENDFFDCIISYHVISHTDSRSIKRIISEIYRILKKDGEFFLTLCSKESESFNIYKDFKIDENTIIKQDGIESGIPHFYVDFKDILDIFKDFKIEKVRKINDCFFNNKEQNSIHYFIFGSK